MQFILTINMDNAAFEDAPLGEVARILKEQATKMERFSDQNPSWSDTLLDVNGNVVGYANTRKSHA